MQDKQVCISVHLEYSGLSQVVWCLGDTLQVHGTLQAGSPVAKEIACTDGIWGQIAKKIQTCCQTTDYGLWHQWMSDTIQHWRRLWTWCQTTQWMNEWMISEWLNERTNEQINKIMNEWMNDTIPNWRRLWTWCQTTQWINEWMNERTNEQINKIK
jgi:hypothetical protein